MGAVSITASSKHRRGNAFFHDLEDNAGMGNWRQTKGLVRILPQALGQHPGWNKIYGSRPLKKPSVTAATRAASCAWKMEQYVICRRT